MLLNYIAIFEIPYVLSRARPFRIRRDPRWLSPSMDVTTTPPRDLEIWIDGDCAVCRRSQRWCAARDHGRNLTFRDLHSPGGVEPPAELEDLMHAVHVRRSDGTVATGYDAWLLVLAQLPNWRRLAGFGAWPPVRRIGRFVYSLVARGRHRLSRLIAPGLERPPIVHGNGSAQRPVVGDGCDQDVEVELDGPKPGRGEEEPTPVG